MPSSKSTFKRLLLFPPPPPHPLHPPQNLTPPPNPQAGRRTFGAPAAALPAYPDYVLNAPSTSVTTLDGGLRVASETTFGSETATVGVFIDAGSR